MDPQIPYAAGHNLPQTSAPAPTQARPANLPPAAGYDWLAQMISNIANMRMNPWGTTPEGPYPNLNPFHAASAVMGIPTDPSLTGARAVPQTPQGATPEVFNSPEFQPPPPAPGATPAPAPAPAPVNPPASAPSPGQKAVVPPEGQPKQPGQGMPQGVQGLQQPEHMRAPAAAAPQADPVQMQGLLQALLQIGSNNPIQMQRENTALSRQLGTSILDR